MSPSRACFHHCSTDACREAYVTRCLDSTIRPRGLVSEWSAARAAEIETRDGRRRSSLDFSTHPAWNRRFQSFSSILILRGVRRSTRTLPFRLGPGSFRPSPLVPGETGNGSASSRSSGDCGQQAGYLVFRAGGIARRAPRKLSRIGDFHSIPVGGAFDEKVMPLLAPSPWSRARLGRLLRRRRKSAPAPSAPRRPNGSSRNYFPIRPAARPGCPPGKVQVTECSPTRVRPATNSSPPCES